MERYDKYKDSGFDWIGEIPEHWKVKRIRYLYDFSMGQTILKSDLQNNGKIPVYSATESDTVFGYVNSAKVLLYKGDFVIPARGNSIGHIYLVEGESTCTQTTIYGKKKNTNNNPTEFVYFYQKGLRTHLFQFDRTAIPQITVEQVKNNTLLIPPFKEQTTIANYLDQKTAEIDELISKKEQLLKLYEEEKTAIINQAVTKGINPDVKLKDSGIDWLGEIPEHWEVKKLKYVCKIQGRIGFKGYRSADLVSNGDGAITLGASHISKKNKIDISKPIYLRWEKYFESPEIMVKKDDIVFTQRGAYLGKVGLIDKDYGEVTINPSLILLKNIKVNSEFLSFFLTSNFIKENVSVFSSDTAIPMISQHQTANFYCIFPPLEEQTAIVQHIETEINRINAKAEKTKKLIDLLVEYKQSLISEVVTGKVKVV